MVTAKILRFSPRTISLTFPLTGETYLISSLYLSQNTGEPHLTSSPSFNSILGTNPGKSVGLSATTLASFESAIILSDSPLSFISRPFLTDIFINDEKI